MLIEEFDIRLVRQAVCYDCVETISGQKVRRAFCPNLL